MIGKNVRFKKNTAFSGLTGKIIEYHFNRNMIKIEFDDINSSKFTDIFHHVFFGEHIIGFNEPVFITVKLDYKNIEVLN